MRSLETPENLTQDQLIVTVGAKRSHCAEVLFQSSGLRAPRQKDHHYWCQTLQLPGVLFQPKTYEPPDGNFFTVGVKRFRARKCYSSPKVCGLPDGNIITIGAKRSRHAEVLFQPSSQPPEPTSPLSRATCFATPTSAKYLYANVVLSKRHEHAPGGF